MACRLSVRVTPKAARTGIAGWRIGADGREELELRVTEAPADGAANEAVVRLLAKTLRVSRSSIVILSGHTSRHKRIEVPLTEQEVRTLLG